MPDWMRPRQQWFDTAAADMAIEAVATLRFVLAMSWDVEADAARTALIAWNGRAAQAFAQQYDWRTVTRPAAKIFRPEINQ